MTFPIDFAAAWQTYVREHKHTTIDPDSDRAYWERYAPHYDQRIPLDAHARARAVVVPLLRPDDTLLE